MALQHNYIEGTGRKPTSSAIAEHELVINQTDKQLWTKHNNTVRGIGNTEVNPWIYPTLHSITNIPAGMTHTVHEYNARNKLRYKFIDTNNIIITGTVFIDIIGSHDAVTLFRFPSSIYSRFLVGVRINASLHHWLNPANSGFGWGADTRFYRPELLANTNGEFKLTMPAIPRHPVLLQNLTSEMLITCNGTIPLR